MTLSALILIFLLTFSLKSYLKQLAESLPKCCSFNSLGSLIETFLHPLTSH